MGLFLFISKTYSSCMLVVLHPHADTEKHPSPRSPVTPIFLLPSTSPSFGQTSVSPSLCPVQSQPPTGSVRSQTEPQHPRAGTAAGIASQQTASLLGYTDATLRGVSVRKQCCSVCIVKHSSLSPFPPSPSLRVLPSD